MKSHTTFRCRDCGATAPRWQGRCGGCAQWNTLEESTSATSTSESLVTVRPLRDAGEASGAVVATGVEELDRVFGGGVVAGSTTLLYGEPGVGKSTLALAASLSMASAGYDVLVLASEESGSQVARRARRLGDVPQRLDLATTTNVDDALALLSERPRTLCVIDSISALSDPALASVTGSIAQVRSVAERLCAAARASDTALLLIGHVTKDGELAGPRALEHLVDTVLRIDGDRYESLRVVRAQKHRFGPTGEVGLFEMGSDGLHAMTEVALASRSSGLDVPGVVLTVTNDGSRSFVVEIQALVASSVGGTRRVAHQVNSQRLALLLAVLEARGGVNVSTLDVFAATAGGLAANEPAVDLALALAVASAALGFAVSATTVAIGEVGLAGELRVVSGLTRRVREAARLGADVVIVPSEGDVDDVPGVDLRRCRSLVEAIAVVSAERRAA